METYPSNGVTESLVWRIQHTIFALHCTTVVTNVSSYCHLVVRRFCNFSDGWKWMEMGWDDEMIPMLSYVLTALENTMARDAIQWSNQHFPEKNMAILGAFLNSNGGYPNSYILKGLSVLNHPLWGTPIMDTSPIYRGGIPHFQTHYDKPFLTGPTSLLNQADSMPD